MCLRCYWANIDPYSVYCRHPHRPGRTMARDSMNYENSELKIVCGQEEVVNCCVFKPSSAVKVYESRN
jgi:hypothetical protein